MGTSIGSVLDYYLAAFTDGLTVTGQMIPALRTIEKHVEVADYSPTTANGCYVILGRSDGDQTETADVSTEYATLGAARVEESYEIPGIVMVTADGPSPVTARRPCLALYDGVVRLVHADPGCGGILQSGRIAQITRAALDQSDPSGTDGTVMATMRFSISVKNSYIP